MARGQYKKKDIKKGSVRAESRIVRGERLGIPGFTARENLPGKRKICHTALYAAAGLQDRAPTTLPFYRTAGQHSPPPHFFSIGLQEGLPPHFLSTGLQVSTPPRHTSFLLDFRKGSHHTSLLQDCRAALPPATLLIYWTSGRAPTTLPF
jgi:hypothetical protein